MKTADLHFHTLNSDGKHSVQEILRLISEARPLGLELAVLTDHDGVGGFEEFQEGVKDWFQPICASELSCEFEDPATKTFRELHLLVYGLDPKDLELQAKFAEFRQARHDRFFKICERLGAAGIKVDAVKMAKRHQGVLGRPHVADALVEAGHAKDRVEAFDRYLKAEKGFMVKKWRFSLTDAVQWAKVKNWKTSIAHPGQYGFKDLELRHFRDLGVNAIEIYHPRHKPEDVVYYRAAAQRYDFKTSGGSDFHDSCHDHLQNRASLGRTQYPLDEAKAFLGDLISG